MQDLVKTVKADANYAKFKKIVEGIRKRVDIAAATAEVLSLHAGRTSRSLTGDQRYNPMALIDASMKDLSYRSRMVEVRVKHDLQLSVLRESIAAMRRHISTEYNDELKDFSTAEQRRAFGDRVVKNAGEFLAEGEALVDMIDMLIKDIDQGGYQFKNTIECLKMLAESKGSKVV
jgi:hypothetical protein